VNKTNLKLPDYVSGVRDRVAREGYPAIIAGPWLRNFLVFKDKFDVDSMSISIYLGKPSNSWGGRQLSYENNPGAHKHNELLLTGLVRAALPSTPIMEHHHFSEYPDNTGDNYPVYEIKTGGFNIPHPSVRFLFRVIKKEDVEMIEHVSQFVMGINKCIFDGKRYRLFDDFVYDYQHQTISVPKVLFDKYENRVKMVHSMMGNSGFDGWQLRIT